MKEYNGEHRVQLVKRGDKYVMEFDDIPALLFVSYDGNGSMDQTFYNGEFLTNVKAVTIRSEVEVVTEYETSNYAIVVGKK